MIPDLPSNADAPVQFDSDMAMPVREAIAGLGHAVELRTYRSGGVLHLDWWYDSRRLSQTVVQALADALSAAVLQLVREAVAEDDLVTEDDDDDELVLVDLSSTDSA